MISHIVRTYQRYPSGSYRYRYLYQTSRKASNELEPRTQSFLESLSSPHPQNRRLALSRAITLIESSNPNHQRQANLLLDRLLAQQRSRYQKSDKTSIRIGIAGPPGAGKSSFIERLGSYILSLSPTSSLAVLCIDPSSSLSGGSILGDKTRMTSLSAHPRAFVRPSPTRGALGGLNSRTSDSVSLCSSAGYDNVLIETVGLGQSEVEISQAVDVLMLLIPPAGGDELQGCKKGIVEVADMMVVNKADGGLLDAAKKTKGDYLAAVRLLGQAEAPPVLLASAKTGEGIERVWEELQHLKTKMIENGLWERKRREQRNYWMWKNVQDVIRTKTHENKLLHEKARDMKISLDEGTITPRTAAERLLEFLWMIESNQTNISLEDKEDNSDDDDQGPVVVSK